MSDTLSLAKIVCKVEFKLLQVNVDTQISGRELQPLQRVGYKLALFVLGYMFIASIAIFLVSFRYIQLPPLPTPPLS